MSSVRNVKIVVCGLSGAGKTSLIKCYEGGKFMTRNATTFWEVLTKDTKIVLDVGSGLHELISIRLQVWDTVGSVSADKMSLVLRDTHAVILVFDLNFSAIKNFEAITEKMMEFLNLFKSISCVFPRVIITGTKSDLIEIKDCDLNDIDLEGNFISSVAQSKYAFFLTGIFNILKLKLGNMGVDFKFIPTSAKHDENVTDCFNIILKDILSSEIDLKVPIKSHLAISHMANYGDSDSLQHGNFTLVDLKDYPNESNDTSSCC